jgi:hypothetical protein
MIKRIFCRQKIFVFFTFFLKRSQYQHVKNTYKDTILDQAFRKIKIQRAISTV